MRKNFVFIFFCFIIITLNAQDFSYKYDNDLKMLYYEKVLDCQNMDSVKLQKKIIEFFDFYKIKDIKKDEGNIYGMAQCDAVYKGWFLFFGRSTGYKCFYDVKISVKSNKVKYYLYNFIFVPKAIAVNSLSWAGKPSDIGTLGVSRQRIPTSIPQKKYELFYREKKFKRKYKIFYQMESNIMDFEDKLLYFIKKEDANW